MPEALTIRPVQDAADLEAVVELFKAYVDSLGIDLGYQDFAAELASLPGKYAPPKGELLLARNDQGEPVGCVGLRPIDSRVCEMKRLYVDPRGRGLGLGKALMEAVLEAARQRGYVEIRLDTLPTMEAAIAMYRKAGFLEVAPYFDTPVEGNLFMARQL